MPINSSFNVRKRCVQFISFFLFHFISLALSLLRLVLLLLLLLFLHTTETLNFHLILWPFIRSQFSALTLNTRMHTHARTYFIAHENTHDFNGQPSNCKARLESCVCCVWPFDFYVVVSLLSATFLKAFRSIFNGHLLCYVILF